MGIKKYLALVKRGFKLLIILPLSLAAFTLLLNSLTVPTYEASATLLVNQAYTANSSQDYNALLAIDRLAKTYRELLRERPVLEKVIRDNKLTVNEEQLAKVVTVEIVRDTQLMRLSVEDTNPQRAALLANAISKEFIKQNQARQENRYLSTKQSLQQELDKIQDEITKAQQALENLKATTNSDQLAEQNRLQTLLAQYRNSYSNLLKSYEDVRLDEARSTDSIDIVVEAKVPPRPIRPNIPLSVILAALVGLLAALSILLFIEYLDDSVKDAEQIKELTGVPTLALFSELKDAAKVSQLIVASQPNSPSAEAYRLLKANIEFAQVDKPIRTLSITSSNSGEGKTTMAANLAITIAQSGKRVLLVDANLRQPKLHNYFGQPNNQGLTSLLFDQEGVITSHVLQTDTANLLLLPSGHVPPNAAELVGSKRMAELISQLQQHFDIVIFDSPAIIPVVDAMLIARHCDATLLVVKARTTSNTVLKKVCTQIEQSGVRLLGIALTNVPEPYQNYYNLESPGNHKKGWRRWLPVKKQSKHSAIG